MMHCAVTHYKHWHAHWRWCLLWCLLQRGKRKRKRRKKRKRRMTVVWNTSVRLRTDLCLQVVLLHEKRPTLVLFVVWFSPQLEFSLGFQHDTEWPSCCRLWYEVTGGDGQEDKQATKEEWSLGFLKTLMKKLAVSATAKGINLNNNKAKTVQAAGVPNKHNYDKVFPGRCQVRHDVSPTWPPYKITKKLTSATCSSRGSWVSFEIPASW